MTHLNYASPSDSGMTALPSCVECGSDEDVSEYEDEDFFGPPYETWWCSTCKHEIDCYGDRLSDDVVWTFCPSCGKDIHPKQSDEDGLFHCDEEGCPDGLFRKDRGTEHYRDQARRTHAPTHVSYGQIIRECEEAQALRYVEHPDYAMNETLREAHPGVGNWGLVKQSTLVGCCYCLEIMPAESLNEKTDVTRDMTIVCPNCQIDCVLCDASGFPVTIEFLTAMRSHWF